MRTRRLVGAQAVVQDPELQLDLRLIGIHHEEAFEGRDCTLHVTDFDRKLRIFNNALRIAGLAHHLAESEVVFGEFRIRLPEARAGPRNHHGPKGGPHADPSPPLPPPKTPSL